MVEKNPELFRHNSNAHKNRFKTNGSFQQIAFIPFYARCLHDARLLHSPVCSLAQGK
jgi:hypothetical protein